MQDCIHSMVARTPMAAAAANSHVANRLAKTNVTGRPAPDWRRMSSTSTAVAT
jgi:hypothetical protein